MYLSVFLFKVLAFPTQIKYWIGQSPRADCSAWRYSIWDNPSASRSLMSCNLVLVWVKRVLLPAKFLVCLPHCCHSWASAKLAGGPLMDLTDCGFGADSDGFFWCGILMDCVRESTIQAIIARHLPDSPILQVGHFYIQLNRGIWEASFIKSGLTADDGILYWPVINQLRPRGNNFKSKNFLYAKIKKMGVKYSSQQIKPTHVFHWYYNRNVASAQCVMH